MASVLMALARDRFGVRSQGLGRQLFAGLPLRALLRNTFFAGVLLGGLTTTAQAAESVHITYGNLVDVTIPLTDIANYAKTGTKTQDIQFLLDVAPSITEAQIKQFLTGDIKVDAAIAEPALKTYLAEVLLKEISTVLNPKNAGTNTWVAIGAALGAAAQDGSLSVLEVLQNYQPPTIDLDAQNVLKVLERIDQDAKTIVQVASTQLGINFSRSGDPMAALRSLLCPVGSP